MIAVKSAKGHCLKSAPFVFKSEQSDAHQPGLNSFGHIDFLMRVDYILFADRYAINLNWIRYLGTYGPGVMNNLSNKTKRSKRTI